MDALMNIFTEYRMYFAIGLVIAGIVWGVLKLSKRGQHQSSGDRSANVQAGRDARVDKTNVK